MYESVYMYLVSSFLLLYHQGIMLVYDVTNEKSFDNIRNWIRNIEEVIHNINLQTVWGVHRFILVVFSINIACL